MFARRFDCDEYKLSWVKRGLLPRAVLNTIQIPEWALNDLTPAEMEFFLAIQTSRRVNPGYYVPLLLYGPWMLLAGMGLLFVYGSLKMLLHDFSLAFMILFGSMLLGYLLGTLISWRARRSHDAKVFHDALMLTGNPLAAESYLLRSFGDPELRGRRISGAKRALLERSLAALRDASDRLGLEYSRLAAQS